LETAQIETERNPKSGSSATFMSLIDLNATVPPEVRLRFTDVSHLANTTTKRYLLSNNGARVNPLAVTDCQLRGVYGDFYSLAGSGMTVALTNNLV
jgi:hypothetical protein